MNTPLYDLDPILLAHDVRPTANRIMVARALAAAGRPLSMTELETTLATVDKSSIFRTLMLFRDHHLVHVVEGGDGVRYELCHSHEADVDDDEHVHFYCERCHNVYCLDTVTAPAVTLPQGYRARAINYMVKGLCPGCAAMVD